MRQIAAARLWSLVLKILAGALVVAHGGYTCSGFNGRQCATPHKASWRHARLWFHIYRQRRSLRRPRLEKWWHMVVTLWHATWAASSQFERVTRKSHEKCTRSMRWCRNRSCPIFRSNSWRRVGPVEFLLGGKCPDFGTMIWSAAVSSCGASVSSCGTSVSSCGTSCASSCATFQPTSAGQ